MRILGIDPGTGICGFGVIEVDGRNNVRMITAGVISTPPHTPLADRLLDIYDSLSQIIDECKPDETAVEKLFFNQNITTGITVAEARGVIMLVARQHNLVIAEYTPLQIKQTLTGYGRADKKQMQEMVRIHLNLKEIPKPDDAADALATAITHSLMRKGV
ncbi:MAG: crossover junction endodeoxyribonuclease RuvC [Candidatus Nomurabacteria bacterium]|jgi:crossover junction endodeoxyribonuclease RuvC|nr:crossover junction endodeoxyribonuclease RuvC [Candidatus Nomurabacteria bacterium]